MLWDVVGTPHKLLGSVHVLPIDSILPGWAASCHSGIARIVFEADHRDPSIAQVGLDTTGAHLDQPGAAILYERAAELTAAVGKTDTFDGYRPWRAAFHLMTCLLPTFGLFHEYGMDNRLRVHADGHGLQTDFLETPPKALELIDAACASEGDGLHFFEYVIRSAASGAAKAELLRILNSWTCRDTVDLAKIQTEKLVQFPYLYEPLISRRNADWLSPIQSFLDDSTPTLIVVGSLHIVGTDGLISALENSGFTLMETRSNET